MEDVPEYLRNRCKSFTLADARRSEAFKKVHPWALRHCADMGMSPLSLLPGCQVRWT